MYIFLRLLLAHFIADFLFQSDQIFRLKNRHFLGLIAHGLIVFIVSVVCCLMYVQRLDLVLFLLYITATHILVDKTKIYLLSRYKINETLAFFIDQAIHLLIISTVFLTDLINLPACSFSNKYLNLYNNDAFIVFIIGYILTIWGGNVLILYLKESRSSKNNAVKFLGSYERFMVTTLVMIGGFYLLLIPIIYGPRALLYLKEGFKFGFGPFEFCLHLSCAVFIGIMLRFAVYL
jgi:hypothetical protein